MAYRSLPGPSRHNDSYRVTLDGSVYTVEWSWNARSDRWWIRLSDDDGQIVYLPAVEGFPLLRSVTGTRRPAGELVVIDTLDEHREPGLRDFPTDFELLYIEASEIPETYNG